MEILLEYLKKFQNWWHLPHHCLQIVILPYQSYDEQMNEISRFIHLAWNYWVWLNFNLNSFKHTKTFVKFIYLRYICVLSIFSLWPMFISKLEARNQIDIKINSAIFFFNIQGKSRILFNYWQLKDRKLVTNIFVLIIIT